MLRPPEWPAAAGNFACVSGEDPHLGHVMGAAVTRGIQSQGVTANAKHCWCPTPRATCHRRVLRCQCTSAGQLAPARCASPALDTHAVSMWSEPRVHQAAADEPPQKPSFADLSLPAPRPPNRTTRHNHVVILNNQGTCRLRASVAISKRVLMEICMQPFAGAVSAGVGSVRCSCMTTPPPLQQLPLSVVSATACKDPRPALPASRHPASPVCLLLLCQLSPPHLRRQPHRPGVLVKQQ